MSRPRLDAVALAPLHPWKAPWWRPTPGDAPTFVWIVLIHLGAAAALILTPLPGWRIVLGAYLLHFLGGLGTTVAYHRSLAHKTVKLHPVVKNLLILLAISNGSGSPLSWAAYHRLHHAKSDTPEDISSPGVGGFWWSHLRWLYQAGLPPISRYARELDTPGLRFWEKIQAPLLLLSFFGGWVFGLAGFLWLGPLRLCVALHSQCFVNSICHLRKDMGPEGTAKNVAWLTPLHCFQGENWHENHHARPGSARIGQGFWQFDVGYATIRLLELVGLAKDVRRPTVASTAMDVAA